jgi:hypothetical protein
MPQITLLFSALLIGLGLYGYYAPEKQSPTALIPAAFGILLGISGLVALIPKARKHAMHGAVMVGLLGTSSLFMAMKNFGKPEKAFAVNMQIIMGVLCIVFVVLCVNSFIQARKRLKAAAQVAKTDA